MIRERLIARAKRTPYFHLDGYMNRYWLVPYREVQTRVEVFYSAYDMSVFIRDDNTGPVPFWSRPIAKLLQAFDIAARIHELLRSDRDPAPHSHPWSYLTIILFGGYWEERYDDDGLCISRRWHGPGSILWRPAGSWHRLDLPPGTTTWTLFITFKKQGSWGFNVGGKTVPWREYLKEHKQ